MLKVSLRELLSPDQQRATEKQRRALRWKREQRERFDIEEERHRRARLIRDLFYVDGEEFKAR